jgi:hypothetical protein
MSLSPLKTLIELESANQNLKTSVESMSIVLQDLMEKNSMTFSYLTNENFLEKTQDGLEILLKQIL